MGPSKPYTPKPETQARLIAKQAAKIYPEDVDGQQAFVKAVLGASSAKPTAIWMGAAPETSGTLVGWQPGWISDRTEAGEYSRGDYYPLDYSSVVSASIMLTVNYNGGPVLDLCAAPGGKGVFAWRALQPSLLVANEVVGKRAGMLISNLKRCHVSPCLVTRLDPVQFANMTPRAFEVTIVDAPCSGQSLIAKGESAAGAFQPNMIAANMTRQRRILANAVATVAPNGYLAYMTCTYSREENEKNVEWLLRRFPALQAVEVPHLSSLRSHLAEFPCYRHAPQDGLGVGGFAALLRNSEPGTAAELRPKSLRPIWQS